MHARVSTIRARTGRLDDLVHVLRHSLLPPLRGAPGFAGAQLLHDAATGTALALTLWESAEALAASEGQAIYRLVDSALLADLVERVEVAHYAVVDPPLAGGEAG